MGSCESTVFCNRFSYNLNPVINLLKDSEAMETQIKQGTEKEEIQVYRNDFISGVILLTRKLFML
jgi:hypothetical protein